MEWLSWSGGYPNLPRAKGQPAAIFGFAHLQELVSHAKSLKKLGEEPFRRQPASPTAESPFAAKNAVPPWAIGISARMFVFARGRGAVFQ